MKASTFQRRRRYQWPRPVSTATAVITIVLPSQVRAWNTAVEACVAWRAPQSAAAASARYRPVREVTMSATWPKASAARKISRSATVSARRVASAGSKRRRRNPCRRERPTLSASCPLGRRPRRGWLALTAPMLQGGGLLAPGLETALRVEQVAVVARRAAQMLAPQAQAQVASEDAGAVAEAGRVRGWSRVEGGVEHGCGELRVMGPRAAVEVVRADRGPHVVDDADLGVDVDRSCILVLEVVDGGSLAPCGLDHVEGGLLAAAVGRAGEGPVLVGVPSWSGYRGTTAIRRSSGHRRSASARSWATSVDH